jgi:hypothetical protein
MSERQTTEANDSGKAPQGSADDLLCAVLRRFKAIGFPAERGAKVDEAVIDRLMEKTAPIRRKVTARKSRILFFSHPVLLATAACLMLVFGAALFMRTGQEKSDFLIVNALPDSRTFAMRGGDSNLSAERTSTTLTSAAHKKSDETMERQKEADMGAYVGIATIISAITALVAVLVGPFLTACIQRRERLSEMREKWINELRDVLASVAFHAEACAAIPVHPFQESKEFKDAYAFLVQQEGKAKMMLNPKEADHRRLQTCLENIVLLINARALGVNQMDEMRALTTKLIPIAQAVIKEAWDRTK